MIIQLVSKINHYPNLSEKVREDRSYVHAKDNIWHWYLESMSELCLDDYEVTQESYDAMVIEITENLSLVRCPKCSSTESLEATQITYKRSMINSTDEINDPVIIEVVVFYCRKCKTYHALIPWGAIPFTSFTYRFVIEVLYSYYFENSENKKKTSDQFEVPRSTISSWIEKFKSDSGTVPELHELKDLVSAHVSKDDHAFHENDLEKLRTHLLERLAKYKAFLCAFLIERMDISGMPFLISAGGAVKNNSEVRKFHYQKIICLLHK